MQFEWDKNKNEKNIKKHHITFEEAQSSWLDPYAVERFDILHSVEEERFVHLGYSCHGRIIVTIFNHKDDQTIRIISSRKATLTERKRYEKRI